MKNTSIYVTTDKVVDSEALGLIIDGVWDSLDDADKEFIVVTLKEYKVDFELYPKNLITMAD